MPEIKIQEGFEHDCNECQGLCCVALEIDKSHEFPNDKPAGLACDMLNIDPQDQANICRCKVFATLGKQGRTLCEDFSCLGAGNTIGKFFNELGINWAFKPENIDEQKWELMKNNIFNAYQIFHNVFLYLRRIRNQRHPANKLMYDAARASAENTAKELAQVLEEGSAEIICQDWYENKFKTEMQIAVHDANSAYLLNKLKMPKWW